MAGATEIRDFSAADPVLRYMFPIKPEAETLGKWQRTFDYDVWTQCRPVANDDLLLWEAHHGGVVRIPKQPYLMHVIKAGVPHHVEGLFGYWRTSESDIIWFRIVRDSLVHEAMILGGCPSAYQRDSISWICPSCATEFGKRDVETGRKNLSRFWAEETKAVATFNASEAARSCPKCGRVHPPAYSFRRPGADENLTGPAW